MSEYNKKTKIFRSNKEFIFKRVKRIKEAISFEGGTIENPIKHLISFLPNGEESYFLKPGKETLRKVPIVKEKPDFIKYDKKIGRVKIQYLV